MTCQLNCGNCIEGWDTCDTCQICLNPKDFGLPETAHIHAIGGKHKHPYGNVQHSHQLVTISDHPGLKMWAQPWGLVMPNPVDHEVIEKRLVEIGLDPDHYRNPDGGFII